MLRAQGRTVECLLAGTPDHGNPRSASREQVERWHQEGLVRWLGHVEDMPSLLRTVDVMVLPSYLVFRLIVTYYALETLLTLAFEPAVEVEAASEPPVLILSPNTSPPPWEEEEMPIPINAEA